MKNEAQKKFNKKYESAKARIKSISASLEALKRAQDKDPSSWGNLGDAGHVDELLEEIETGLNFLTNCPK